MDFEDLKGKTVAITGGAGVIAHGLGHGLAEVGMDIVILDIDAEKAETFASELQEQHGIKSAGIGCDVLDPDSIKQARDSIVKTLGSLDFLINGAGGNSPDASTELEQLEKDTEDFSGSFFDLPLDAFRKTLNLNLLGTVLPSQILGQLLAKQGSGAIMNISSMNAYRPLTKIPAYSAGKCAVSNFTEWLAVHLAQTGVRVNAIAPGFFLTEQLKFLAFDEKGELTDRYRRVLQLTPMNRFGDQKELIGPTLFLLSELSAFITGVIIPVDGGFNAYSGV
ncbi:MAG: D-mannonate oxidoreductase [Opitutaceae bacterium]|nr:D-mannonate oxidoreductase [Opitutaceae bacterium]|tara:strand:- start:1454 stop:2290 length:837 start_codon:yes stop_codon:yes gene_type:complete